jgi:hypothetical protein
LSFLLILLDVLVDLVGELQLVIYLAGVGVVSIRADREVLLPLSL